MNIKAAIFDIGGVVLDDPVISFWQDKEGSKQLRELFGTGSLPEAEFIRQGSILMEMDEVTFLKKYSTAYSGMKPIADVASIFKKITIPKYIFSDTNPIHFKFCRLYFPEIISQATKLFLSYETKLHKDSDAIYPLILAQIPFKATELVFIDNKGEYIEKARGFGINGIVYKRGMDLEQALLELDSNIFN